MFGYVKLAIAGALVGAAVGFLMTALQRPQPEEERSGDGGPRFALGAPEPADPLEPLVVWHLRNREDVDSALEIARSERLSQARRDVLHVPVVAYLLSNDPYDRSPAGVEEDVDEATVERARRLINEVQDAETKGELLSWLNAAYVHLGETEEADYTMGRALSISQRAFRTPLLPWLEGWSWPALLGLLFVPVGIFFKAVVDETGKVFAKRIARTSGSARSTQG